MDAYYEEVGKLLLELLFLPSFAKVFARLRAAKAVPVPQHEVLLLGYSLYHSYMRLLIEHLRVFVGVGGI